MFREHCLEWALQRGSIHDGAWHDARFVVLLLLLLLLIVNNRSTFFRVAQIMAEEPMSAALHQLDRVGMVETT